MKTKVKVSAIILAAFVLSSKAQIKVNNSNDPKPIAYVSHGGSMNNGHGGNNSPDPQNNQGNPNAQGSWQNNNGYSNGSLNFNFNYGNYPLNGWGYVGPAYGNYNNYNNYYGGNLHHAAKQMLYASKAMINQSIDIHNWNDIYSPMLAKAIRHHNYAKQMYWWGNYNAAIQHAERAKYLAWCSLQYFQNPNAFNGGYGGNYYQDPYGDPNDPYYRKGNPDAKMQNANGSNTYQKQAQEADEIDKKLPEQNTSDKELIRDYYKSKDE